MANNLNQPRGTSWVVGQIILLAGIFVLPFLFHNPLTLLSPISTLISGFGLLVAIVGVVVLLWSAQNLSTNLTVFPRPKSDGTLVQTGLYGLVRHPIYSGMIFGSLGWSLLWGGLPALVLSLILLILLDNKSRFEEHLLMERFPDYAAYRQRVRKFLPWVY